MKEIMRLHIVNPHKPCPKCGKADNLEVRNYDALSQDGEVWCKSCNVYVREYDAS
jgi:hypothetical protein